MGRVHLVRPAMLESQASRGMGWSMLCWDDVRVFDMDSIRIRERREGGSVFRQFEKYGRAEEMVFGFAGRDMMDRK